MALSAHGGTTDLSRFGGTVTSRKGGAGKRGLWEEIGRFHSLTERLRTHRPAGLFHGLVTKAACPVTPESVLSIREASIQISDRLHRNAQADHRDIGLDARSCVMRRHGDRRAACIYGWPCGASRASRRSRFFRQSSSDDGTVGGEELDEVSACTSGAAGRAPTAQHGAERTDVAWPEPIGTGCGRGRTGRVVSGSGRRRGEGG